MLVVKDAVALCRGFAGCASGVHTDTQPGRACAADSYCPTDKDSSITARVKVAFPTTPRPQAKLPAHSAWRMLALP